MMDEPLDWPTKDLLAHRVESTPDRTALVAAETGESWTYRELDRRVSSVTERIEGSCSHGRVGILMDNRVAFVEMVHAAMRVAATLVPLNVRLSAAELRQQVGAADLDLLICEAATEGTALEIADCPVASVDSSTNAAVDSLQSDVASVVSSSSIARAWTQLVMFTSGTTGEPKGVQLTAGNLVASATASAFRLGIEPEDRWLVCLPTYHMGGLAPIVRSTLYGTTVVLQEEFDAEETARVIDQHRVTGVSLVPTMLTRLLDADWTPPDYLRFVLLGGAPASRELIERCERRGVPVHPTYGMTETASQVATATPKQAFDYPGTVGQPLLFTTVRIEDEGGELCDQGVSGELVVSGPTVSPGYLDDEQTNGAFDERGFRTGDVGYRDEEGRLWVVGRLDDRIITGGENVHPGEVVGALRTHPDVREAAVVGMPDEEWGERIAALVVPVTPDSIDADDVRAHCEDRLAGFKRPRTVRFTTELPRTASGTVDRKAVRAQLLDDSNP